MKALNKKVKKLDSWDISLIKLSTVAFILFLLSVWPAAMVWVLNTDFWWFLIAFVVFAIRPFMKYFSK
ncbi:MAG: hypothetical protein ABIH92_04925 [Nanoarchaeota archaeon]